MGTESGSGRDEAAALELFAYGYVGDSARGRSAWLNMRINDLGRLVDGVKSAAIRVMDQGASIEELNVEVGRLQARLEHIRQHAAAVAALRSSRKA